MRKGRMQEELESAHQEVIFYRKFHCELNFMEHFWCSAKWYTRENGRRVLPEALDSVTPATINRYYRRCMRTLGAYMDGHTYGTKEFKEKVYRGHRQVADKTKW